jgi:hypothetical protein
MGLVILPKELDVSHLKKMLQSERKMQNGFSIIEVLTALTIIMIMIIAVTPLLLFSLQSIRNSGEYSKATINAAGKIDIGLATRTVAGDASIPIKFKTTTSAISVEGGLVSSSAISSFLPDSSTISITPFAVNEGYSNTVITVVGKRTHFKTGSMTIEIKDKNGNTLNASNPIYSVTNATNMTFTLPMGFKNAQSPLNIKITTNLSAQSSKNEVARTSFVINLPTYVAVGKSANIAVSDNTTSWESRNAGTSLDINNVIWGNDRFVAVGNSGRVYLLMENSDWTSVSTGVNNNLNDIIYTGSTFIAVGSGGTILSSQDGMSWSKITNADSSDINSIAKGGSLYVAVGKGGRILYSSDGQMWQSTAFGSQNLNDIIYDGAQFIAVGDNATAISSINGVTWTNFATGITSTHNLNGISYNGTCYVTVGYQSNRGYIYRKSTGNWAVVTSPNSTIFFDVISSNNKFLIVNSTNYLYVLNSDGSLPTTYNIGTGNLYGITGR